MTTSKEHERVKKRVGDLLTLYFDELGIEITPRGQATMRLPMKQAGAEPDESWCFNEDKEFPDLVLEISLTSGGIQKRELYARFGVPELWFWQSERLRIFVLQPDAKTYEEVSQSRWWPKLNLALLERCVKLPSWREARQPFRQGLAATPG